MKKQISRFYEIIIIGALGFAGCSTNINEQQIEATDSPLVLPSISPTGVAEKEETVLNEDVQLAISDQAYISQSGAYQINLPFGWNCSETGEYQVNCQSVDQSAELQAEITATGYELEQQALISYAHAEMVHTYSDVKEYIEVNAVEEEGYLKYISVWRDGDVYWRGIDSFLRTRGTVFHLNTNVHDSTSEKYIDLFSEIDESIVVKPNEMQLVPLYANRTPHIAPDAFFEVEVPTAWSWYIDAATLEKTVIEGFLSPDKRAAVQIAVYRKGAFIDQSIKAEKTMEIMRAQYGYDLRVSHDKALPDGRERLDWSAMNKGINGISFFDSYGSSLYVFSIVWEESTADIYKPLLEEISASFARL